MSTLESITRPDGRVYRPRKIAGYPVADADDLISGVCILGTHDMAVAQPLADECAAYWVETGYVAAGPETGWFREGYENGRPMWQRDEVRGRAGVMFHEVREGLRLPEPINREDER